MNLRLFSWREHLKMQREANEKGVGSASTGQCCLLLPCNSNSIYLIQIKQNFNHLSQRSLKRNSMIWKTNLLSKCYSRSRRVFPLNLLVLRNVKAFKKLRNIYSMQICIQREHAHVINKVLTI